MCVPERLGTEIQYTAVLKKEETDKKGKQGHENKMNPEVSFSHEACLLPPVSEGGFCEKDSSPRSSEGNLFVCWV